MSIEGPAVVIVATPIGNLNDISNRALETLRESDLILAEDTRVSKRLLNAYRIDTPLQAFHEHNEDEITARLIARIIRERIVVAMISDAGTPVISDPGFPLIRAAHDSGVVVTIIPGACAAVAALAISGLPADKFVFEGFPPAKQAARRERYRQLADETRSIILYESPHRLSASLADARAMFGAEREVFIARELTKLHEASYRDTLGAIEDVIAADTYAAKGELVVVIGPSAATRLEQAEVRRTLRAVLRFLSPRDAVALTCEITGEKRNLVYRVCLELTDSNPHT